MTKETQSIGLVDSIISNSYNESTNEDEFIKSFKASMLEQAILGIDKEYDAKAQDNAASTSSHSSEIEAYRTNIKTLEQEREAKIEVDDNKKKVIQDELAACKKNKIEQKNLINKYDLQIQSSQEQINKDTLLMVEKSQEKHKVDQTEKQSNKLLKIVKTKLLTIVNTQPVTSTEIGEEILAMGTVLQNQQVTLEDLKTERKKCLEQITEYDKKIKTLTAEQENTAKNHTSAIVDINAKITKEHQQIKSVQALIKQAHLEAEHKLAAEKKSRIDTAEKSINGVDDALKIVYKNIQAYCGEKNKAKFTTTDLEKLRQITIFNVIYDKLIQICQAFGKYKDISTKVGQKKEYDSHVDQINKHITSTHNIG